MSRRTVTRRLRRRVSHRRRLVLEQLEDRRLLVTFFVNSTDDTPDSGAVPGTCDTELNPDSNPPVPASGICTLRAAIDSSNANSGPDSIHFAIQGSEIPTINLGGLLTIVDSVVVDATTQAAGTVEVRSSGGVFYLLVGGGDRSSSGSTIRGFVINSAGGGIGIGSDNNIIVGNRFGIDTAGTGSLPITGTAIGIFGNNNMIGGNSPEDRNIIASSGAGVTVISVGGIPASNNVILGNYIGTNAEGTAALGHTNAAISINFASGTTVQENVIAASPFGVQVLGSTATGTMVTGNMIGTNVSGAVTNPDGIPGNGDEFGNGIALFVNDAPDAMIVNNVIAGSTGVGLGVDFGYGIHIANANASGAVVKGNNIGVNAGGNAVLANQSDGVFIERVSNITIGGTAAADRNIISGNGGDGVTIFGSAADPASNNQVVGNYIGVDATGELDFGNTFRGVHIDSTAINNTIGGDTSAARNIISGNDSDGVIIALSGATGNVVKGNYIGTDKDGMTEVPNGEHGVFILRAPNNEIGGSLIGEGNVISGNLRSGVRIEGAEATENVVLGNLIGTNKDGVLPVGNVQSGVDIVNATLNHIGVQLPGQTTVTGNTISANPIGVQITGAASTGNVVAGNRIGTDPFGMPSEPVTLLGSSSTGVFIENATNNFIGQATGSDVPCDLQTNPGNVIAGSEIAGVRIEGDSATGNLVRCNSIFANTGVGIDLGGEGVTPNDPLDADASPNQLQNFPVLSLIEQVEGITRVGGSLGSTPTTSFRIDVYATDVSEATSLEQGLQGKRYFGTTVVTTDSTGYVHFEIELPALIDNEVITATATDPSGNTSEFSPFAADMQGKGTFEVRTPVLIVPGIFGSFALDVPGLLGDDGNYREFLLKAGLPPDQLQLDPLIHVYQDLVITLERAGYVQGEDLFLVPYDWRLNLAPITADQDQHDGMITGVSAPSLTDNVIDYGLDYLGLSLRKAAETWFGKYGQPLANVQVIAHSMGGLLARSYIQSTAYGDKFQSSAAGRELPLPVVSNFTMLGVPHQGGTGTWNGWNDNFVENLAYRLVLSKVLNHAWHKLQEGEVIFIGNGERLTAATFEGFDEIEAKIQFVRRYVPGLGNLLPDFDGFAIDFDPALFPEFKNLLLRDLNREVLSGDRVARTIGLYGTSGGDAPIIGEASTPARVKQHVTGFFDDDDVVLSFTDYEADDSTSGVAYYEDILLAAHGDGTVAIESLENLFLNDDRVELIPFCNGTCRPGDRASTGSVSHTSLVSNVDAQVEILKALHHPLSPSAVSTGHESAGFDILLPFFTYNFVVDPVQEAFLVDPQGRRLGYSQATGAVMEIPGSTYFGNEDGIGWVIGDAGGPLRLELVGIGQNHFVQVSGIGPGGDFGIDSSGFLAAGETRSLDVSIPATIIAPVITRNSIVVGPDAGSEPRVRVFDNLSQTERLNFAPYGENFAGGVRVATGNMNGDGTPDIITGAGSSAGGHVKVFSGKTVAEIGSFFAFPAFTGSVTVASGDINGDGFDDIIVGAGPGASVDQVKVFNGQTGAELYSFLAFPGFSGGVTVAAGDINADGFGDIIVGAGAGAPDGLVKVFSGQSAAEIDSFSAFPGFTGGVFVAGGDLNSDGFDDIIVGTGVGATDGHVKVFSGQTAAEIQSFFAFPGFAGGVTVASGDVNHDGTPDIITGPGSGTAPRVKAFDGITLATLDSFLAYDAGLASGVFASGVASPAVTVVPLPIGGGVFEVFEDNGDLVVRGQGDGEVFRGPQANNPRLRIDGTSNVDDRLMVDLNGLSTAITFDGGAGGNDALRLDGNLPFAFLKHQFLSSGDGLVIVDPGTDSGLLRPGRLRHFGLGPIEDDLDVVDRVFTFPDSGDDITLNTGDSAADTFWRIDSNNSVVVDFLQPTGSLTIESAPNDTVDIGLGWAFEDTEVVDGKFTRLFTRDGLKLRMIGPHDWSNPVNPLDVNASGSVEPLDVLIIINELNEPKFRDAAGRFTDAALLQLFPGFFFDTNRDGFLVPLDALIIINFLNSFTRELEGEDALPTPLGRFGPSFPYPPLFVTQYESPSIAANLVSREGKTMPIARSASFAPPQSSPASRQLTRAQYAQGLDELLTELQANELRDELLPSRSE